MKFTYQKQASRALLLILALAGCVGCSTPFNRSPTQWRQGDVVVDDIVLAFGIPNQELANQMGNAKTVAFLGKSHTYLLIEGGPRLAALRQLLDSKRLTLMTNQKKVYIRDQTIWGNLEFRYVAPVSGVFSQAEKEALVKLEFTSVGASTYTSNVRITGVMYPALPLSPNTIDLRQGRRVVFYAPPDEEATPDLSAVVKLPNGLKVGV